MFPESLLNWFLFPFSTYTSPRCYLWLLVMVSHRYVSIRCKELSSQKKWLTSYLKKSKNSLFIEVIHNLPRSSALWTTTPDQTSLKHQVHTALKTLIDNPYKALPVSPRPSQSGPMGASISPVGLLVLCCHPPVEIIWEYLFTIIYALLCVEHDVAVIGMAVKGASGLFQRLGIFRSMAPSMCSYPCSLAQPNLLIIPLSNGVNGHISPRDQREGGRLWCEVVAEIQMYASVYGWRLHNRWMAKAICYSPREIYNTSQNIITCWVKVNFMK